MLSSLNVVIVGNGVAGVTAARIIKENNPKALVSIYSDENHYYYPRPRLYEVLSGETEPKDIYMFSEEWYKKKGIRVHLNKKVLSINTEKKELLIDDQTRVNYDKLILAAGGYPFVPPIKGIKKKGVFTLRSIKDALIIKEFTKETIKIGSPLL